MKLRLFNLITKGAGWFILLAAITYEYTYISHRANTSSIPQL